MKKIFQFIMLTLFTVGGFTSAFAEVRYPDLCAVLNRTISNGDTGPNTT